MTAATLGTMSGRPVPAPPSHIAALMAEAGRTGNHSELRLAHALYVAWIQDQEPKPRRWDDR